MFKLATVLAGIVVLASSAHAQTTGTLDKIKNIGVISLGHRESSIPFSYYDENQKVVGYSQDFANSIVAAIKLKLGIPNLKVSYIPITSQNRIPRLLNNTIDFECGSTGNVRERRGQVDFSNSIFLIGTRLMTSKDSGIKDFTDLKGKTVVTTAGTTSERILRKMNQDKGMGMNITSAKDHGDSFLTLSTGRTAEFMMDDALLAGERAKSNNPGDFVIVGTPQSHEAYDCMIRKNDPEFKKEVDDAITKVETSGEADQIYKRWFESPIPPKGLNLNFPESDETKALFKSPNDKTID